MPPNTADDNADDAQCPIQLMIVIIVIQPSLVSVWPN